jgi:hypothetical protein
MSNPIRYAIYEANQTVSKLTGLPRHSIVGFTDSTVPTMLAMYRRAGHLVLEVGSEDHKAIEAMNEVESKAYYALPLKIRLDAE